MKLIDTIKLWDAAGHNAFSDLIRFGQQWLCVFREGETHISSDGTLRILASSDGRNWTSRARIALPNSDLRDPKLSLAADGQLMLLAAEHLPDESEYSYRSLAWFSRDGASWGEAHAIGDPDFWLWRVTWHQGSAYAAGYDCKQLNQIRFYRSTDGKKFAPIADCPFVGGFPNETSLAFDGDVAYCLLRRDGKPNSGLWGKSHPPYDTWAWKDIGVRLGGPQMLLLPNGIFVAAVRLYDKKVRTAICEIDPATAELTEILALPSGGDTSYAGLVFHDGLLWVSYYSSHEEKTAIYLSRVAVDPQAPSRS